MIGFGKKIYYFTYIIINSNLPVFINNYFSPKLWQQESNIEMFHFQDRECSEVTYRLKSIDRRYQELLELADIRKQRLLDALSLYKLFNESDSVEQWIAEKVIIMSLHIFLSFLKN